MIEIVKSGAIEATNDIHYIIEDDGFVERALLWYYSCRVYLWPFSILNFIAEKVVKTLLARIHATENEDWLFHDDGWVSVARLRSHSL